MKLLRLQKRPTSRNKLIIQVSRDETKGTNLNFSNNFLFLEHIKNNLFKQ